MGCWCNGAGKSTLIGIMVDGIQNYSGEILYGNENIKKLGKDYRKRVGYVPQKQGLYEEFSVLECMNYIAVLKGLKKREVQGRNHLFAGKTAHSGCRQSKDINPVRWNETEGAYGTGIARRSGFYHIR